MAWPGLYYYYCRESRHAYEGSVPFPAVREPVFTVVSVPTVRQGLLQCGTQNSFGLIELTVTEKGCCTRKVSAQNHLFWPLLG